MIQFEEDANSQYLERFNQKDIQLTYHMGQQFYFPITVSNPFFRIQCESNNLVLP